MPTQSKYDKIIYHNMDAIKGGILNDSSPIV